MQEFDSSDMSFTGARRSVGSVLSSKLEGGRARSVRTGHSVVGADEESESEGEGEAERKLQSGHRDFEPLEKGGVL